jgi:hypothetical protein
MTDTRIVTFYPIPARAEATEQKLRQIREDATVSEKAEAWRVFLTRRAA